MRHRETTQSARSNSRVGVPILETLRGRNLPPKLGNFQKEKMKTRRSAPDDGTKEPTKTSPRSKATQRHLRPPRLATEVNPSIKFKTVARN